MKEMPHCPRCFQGTLRVISSRKRGNYREQYRRCNNHCGYRDVVLVHPSVVVETRILPTHEQEIDETKEKQAKLSSKENLE